MSTLVLVTVIEDATEQYKTKYKNNYKEGDNYLLKRLKTLKLSTLLPGENLEENLKRLFESAAEYRDDKSKTRNTLLGWLKIPEISLIKKICDTKYDTTNFGYNNSSSWTKELHAHLIQTITAAKLNRERQDTLQNLIGTLSNPQDETNRKNIMYDHRPSLAPDVVKTYIQNVNEKIENFNKQYPREKLISINIPSTLDVKRSAINLQSRTTICSELEDELKKLEK